MIDCSTTGEAGLIEATDDEQLDFAIQEQRVLVTSDRDFVRINQQRPNHFGIILLTGDRHFGAVVKDLETLATMSTSLEMCGILMSLA